MKVISCEFNIDTACVEFRLKDETLIAIDCTAVETRYPTICMNGQSWIILFTMHHLNMRI